MPLEREEKAGTLRELDRGEPLIPQKREKKKEKGKKSKNQIRDWMALHLFQFSHGSQVPTNSPGEREREGERTALIESKQHGASTMRTRATI